MLKIKNGKFMWFLMMKSVRFQLNIAVDKGPTGVIEMAFGVTV